jgi:hypothetical protein
MKLSLFFVLAAGLASMQGCNSMIRTPAAHASQSRSSSSSKPPDKPIADYQQLILQKYEQEDFTWLSSEASRTRSGKERLPGGYWKLRAFYDAVGQPAPADQSDRGWERVFTRLARWRQQQPKDATPLIALASAWFNYGWEARGDGYASSVSNSAWADFQKRLGTAAQWLEKAQTLNEGDPEFYHQALLVGRSLQWDRSVLERYFAAGTALEPTYYYLYQQKAVYLLPRWGGREGEWEQFADQAANRIGGEQGDVVFFAIYSLMKQMHNINFLIFHRQAAPRIVAGFRVIERLYGASPRRVNEACMASLLTDDPKTTAELLARADQDLDEELWEGRQRFEELRNEFWQQQKASQTSAAGAKH